VSGGSYDRTFSSSDAGPAAGSDPTTVSPFRLDKYEVTVGRFRAFVQAVTGGWTPAVGSGKHAHLNGGQGLADSSGSAAFEAGWSSLDSISTDATIWSNSLLACQLSTWTASAGPNDDLPINCVTWEQAYAFCIWDDGFLPSEAEWEFAAAGGSEARPFPWGSMDPGTNSLYADYGCDVRSDAGTCAIAPVGSASSGAGKWGHLDLAGNVDEWTLDVDAPYVSPCTDCAYLSSTTTVDRIIRGGHFTSVGSSSIQSTARNSFTPTDRDMGNGVRCARTP